MLWLESSDPPGERIGDRLTPAQRQHRLNLALEINNPAEIRQAVALLPQRNVLENAAKFSPPDEAVQIDAKLVAQGVEIELARKGRRVATGLPERFLPRVLELRAADFDRSDRADQRPDPAHKLASDATYPPVRRDTPE